MLKTQKMYKNIKKKTKIFLKTKNYLQMRESNEIDTCFRWFRRSEGRGPRPSGSSPNWPQGP